MKKVLAVALSGVMALSMLTACGGADTHSLANDITAYKLHYNQQAKNEAADILSLFSQMEAIEDDLKEDLKDIKSGDYSITYNGDTYKIDKDELQDFNGAVTKYARRYSSVLGKVSGTIYADRFTTYVAASAAKAAVDANEEATDTQKLEAKEALEAATERPARVGIVEFNESDDDYEKLSAEAIAARVSTSMAAGDQLWLGSEKDENGDSIALLDPTVEYEFGYFEAPADAYEDGEDGHILVWVVYVK